MDSTYVKYLASHEKLAEVDLGRHVSYHFPCDLLSWPYQLKIFIIVLLPVPFFLFFFFEFRIMCSRIVAPRSVHKVIITTEVYTDSR